MSLSTGTGSVNVLGESRCAKRGSATAVLELDPLLTFYKLAAASRMVILLGVSTANHPLPTPPAQERTRSPPDPLFYKAPTMTLMPAGDPLPPPGSPDLPPKLPRSGSGSARVFFNASVLSLVVPIVRPSRIVYWNRRPPRGLLGSQAPLTLIIGAVGSYGAPTPG